jgi:hypothetical protein
MLMYHKILVGYDDRDQSRDDAKTPAAAGAAS